MITQKYLKEILDYNPESGVFTWKIQKGTNGRIGSIAGGFNGEGYRRIMIDNKYYFHHRLAWLYTFGEFPLRVIDHINGVRDDNRLCNLRECSQQENSQNQGVRSNCKAGFKGVHWSEPHKKWRARIWYEGKKIHLGMYDTPEEASKAYNTFAKEHHGEFYKEDKNEK